VDSWSEFHALIRQGRAKVLVARGASLRHKEAGAELSTEEREALDKISAAVSATQS
jgi:hypothetical protein